MPDNKYFDRAIPQCFPGGTCLHDLSRSYCRSEMAPQRSGILHYVAQLGSENPGPSAIFLLEIASERKVVERHPPRRELALSLFLQRVLPHINQERHSEAHRLTLEFLAEEPEVVQRLAATRGRVNTHRFLHSLWRPITGQRTVDRVTLIKATIGAAAYELLLMDNCLPTDVIPQLYGELSKLESGDFPDLASSVWVTRTLSEAPSIRRQLEENPSFNGPFLKDLKKINRLIGFYFTQEPSERNDQMYLLATTLGQLISVLKAFIYEEA